VKKSGSWKGAGIQTGFESGSRGIAIVRRHYQGTVGEDTAVWKILRLYASDLLNAWKSAMAL
jgi:hypothetical protein